MKKTLVLLTTILTFNSVYSQQYSAEDTANVITADFNIWNTVGIKKEIIKNLDVQADFGIRFRKDASVTDQYFGQFNLDYKLNKHFDISAGYRRINDNNIKDGYETYNRFEGYASYKYKLKKFTLAYRLGYNYKKPTDGNNDTAHNLRNRLSVKYNIKNSKITPLLSSELFYHSESDEITNYFSKVRFTLGASYNKKKIGEFNVFYRIEKELNENFPTTTYIVGLGYVYTIASKKKEETK